MGTLLISLLTLVLLLISAFIVLLVLMQRTSQSGGMGAALGGGAAESAFGSETNSILMKGTIYGIVAFFVVALGLYLLYQSAAADKVQDVDLSTVLTAGETAADAETTQEVIETLNAEGTAAVTAEVTGESAPLQDAVNNAAESENLQDAVNNAVESNSAEASDALPATNSN